MREIIASILPDTLRRLLADLPERVWETMEEIRVRQERPLEIVYGGGYGFITSDSRLTDMPDKGYRASKETCLKLLDLLTQHSVYSFGEELKQGFITVKGGHRVGLSGRVNVENGKVRQIKEITGFNIRLAREFKGISRPLLPHVADARSGTLYTTLVVSPPQHGKTTVIRDLARAASCGEWPPGFSAKGLKVGVIDERSEIGGCLHGVPFFDLGPRTDILDGCPKAEGMMMMIRSMSPDVLIVDEIGKPEDAAAIHEARRAGVRIVATVHGLDPEDVKRRPVLRELMEDGAFSRLVCLSRRPGEQPAFKVLDNGGRLIMNA